MARPERVESIADPRLSEYLRVADSKARPLDEERRGLVVGEGRLVVSELLRSGRELRSVLVEEGRLQALEEELSPLDIPVYVADREILQQCNGYGFHRGVLCVARRWELPPPEALWRESGFFLVLEHVSDHENMGAIFRSAVALGVEAVLLGPGCADPLYRRAVRVSMGHSLSLAFSRLDDWPTCLGEMSESGALVVALTTSSLGEDIASLDLPSGQRRALLLGSEASGLSRQAIGFANLEARIAMREGVDSLNVAAAAAIAMHRLSPSS